jgi:hypothetical protein
MNSRSTWDRRAKYRSSNVTGAMTTDGRLAVSTYPSRVKAKDARCNPLVSVAVMGDEFNDSWVQIDGTATVLDMPDAAHAFVEYHRCIDPHRADPVEPGEDG